MIAAICDECGKQVEVDPTFNRRPSGWVTVTRTVETGPHEEHDYCSASCAVVKLTEHLTTEQKAGLRPLPDAWKPFVKQHEVKG